MFPAARVTDLHTCSMCPPPAGAPIAPPGQVTVLIGHLPAARMGDLCICVPPPPMGGDVIVTGAFNVLIGGLPAARMSDLTVKGGVIVSGCPTVLIGMAGFGLPSLSFSLLDLLLKEVMQVLQDVLDRGKRDAGTLVDLVFQKREGYLFGNDAFKFLNVKFDLGYVWDDTEASILVDFEFSGLDINVDTGAEYFDNFLLPFGLRINEDFLTVKLKGQQGVGYTDVNGATVITGMHGRLDGAHAKVATGTVSAYTGQDANNPEALVGLNITVLNAEAASDVTAGDGGQQTGAAGYGKAAASVAEGALIFETNQIHEDGTVTSERAKIGAAGGAVGGGGGGWAVQDESTGRTHAGGEGEIKAVAGGGIAFDVSHGPAYTSTDRYRF